MENNKTIDCEYTDDLVCPYCGAEIGDAWDIGDGKEGDLGKIECDECNKKFTASRHVHFSYSSEKAPCLNGEDEHQWDKVCGAPKEYFEGMFRCTVCGKEKKEGQKGSDGGK
jgi:hypothetical protein